MRGDVEALHTDGSVGVDAAVDVDVDDGDNGTAVTAVVSVRTGKAMQISVGGTREKPSS